MIVVAPSINRPPKDIIPLTSPVGVGNSISNTNDAPGVSVFVKSLFPEFVSEDHPAFIEFMEAYYSWLDSRGQPLHEARKLLENQDIDTVEEEYEEHLFNEFLSILPRSLVADRSIVLKNIKQFYGAKGTEKSFKFLFRILFNSDSYLYYPKVDILRTSDGKWIQNQTLRLTNVVGDVRRIRAQKIRGLKTNTVAFVERFYGITFLATGAYELVLNTASITGAFEPGETIVCSFQEDGNTVTITGTASPLVAKIKVIKPGRGYKLGDLLKIQDAFGEGAIIRASEVDDNGSIIACNVKEYGIGYNTNFPPSQVKFIDSIHPELIPGTGQLNPDVAVVNLVLGATTKYGGYFRNADGQLSTNKYIHDGFFYQQFSYVTFTDRSYNEYKDVMNKVVHPLGFKHFGGISLVHEGNTAVKTGQAETPVRRHQVSMLNPAAKIGGSLVCPDFVKGVKDGVNKNFILNKLSKPGSEKVYINGELIPKNKYTINGKNLTFLSAPKASSLVHVCYRDFEYSTILNSICVFKTKNNLGPSFESIIRDKFSYKPFIKYDANMEVLQNNPPYYGSGLLGKLASTPVSTFEIQKVGVNKPKDIEMNRIKKIRLFPDSCIIQNPGRVVLETLHKSTKNVVAVDSGESATVSFRIINETTSGTTWQAKKNGITIQQGITTLSDEQIDIVLPGENCRVALFVKDNLGREYKSDNITIKIVE